MSALLLLQHAHGDEAMNLAYFWASILTVLLPLTAFIVMAVLVVRSYMRRREADGGGPPPIGNRQSGSRGGDSGLRSGGWRSGS